MEFYLTKTNGKLTNLSFLLHFENVKMLCQKVVESIQSKFNNQYYPDKGGVSRRIIVTLRLKGVNRLNFRSK